MILPRRHWDTEAAGKGLSDKVSPRPLCTPWQESLRHCLESPWRGGGSWPGWISEVGTRTVTMSQGGQVGSDLTPSSRTRDFGGTGPARRCGNTAPSEMSPYRGKTEVHGKITGAKSRPVDPPCGESTGLTDQKLFGDVSGTLSPWRPFSWPRGTEPNEPERRRRCVRGLPDSCCAASCRQHHYHHYHYQAGVRDAFQRPVLHRRRCRTSQPIRFATLQSVG